MEHLVQEVKADLCSVTQVIGLMLPSYIASVAKFGDLNIMFFHVISQNCHGICHIFCNLITKNGLRRWIYIQIKVNNENQYAASQEHKLELMMYCTACRSVSVFHPRSKPCKQNIWKMKAWMYVMFSVLMYSTEDKDPIVFGGGCLI